MKLRLLPAALAVLVLPLTALADPFSEFTIPDHSWRSGTLGANVAGAWLSEGVSNNEQRLSIFQGNLQPRVLFARDSDPLLWLMSFAASGTQTVRDSRSTSHLVGATGTSDSHEQTSTETWQFDGQLRAYPWRTPVGLQAATRVFGNTQQAWFRNFTRFENGGPPVLRQEQSSRQNLHAYRYSATLDLSVGLGRVRDATVVQDVHVLEERLQAAGMITRPLSPQARQKLAALYYVSPFYSNAHDRPARFFWRDLERILREDGALSGNSLDAYGVMRAAEGYSFRIARPRGWFFGPVVSASHDHQGQRLDSHGTHYLFLDDSLAFGSEDWSAGSAVASLDEVSLGGTAEYHRPLGWRWQLDLSSQVTAPLRPGDFGLHALSEAQITWLVADRWLALAAMSHARDYFERRGSNTFERNSWSFDGTLQLGWYVEDHTQLSAALVQTQLRRDVLLPSTREFIRITQFSVALSYRFFGGLEAPDLIEPQRPMR